MLCGEWEDDGVLDQTPLKTKQNKTEKAFTIRLSPLTGVPCIQIQIYSQKVCINYNFANWLLTYRHLQEAVIWKSPIVNYGNEVGSRHKLLGLKFCLCYLKAVWL